jgi:hypothetical protein
MVQQQICNAPVANPNFNCVGNTPGASVLSCLYLLDAHGQLSDSTASGIVSNVVSFGFATATTVCKQSFVASQAISVNCQNALIGQAVANNQNCVDCKAKMQAIADQRTKLEQDAHQLNPSYAIQTPSQIYLDLFNGTSSTDGKPQNDGICQYVCLQCIAKDVQQTLQMTIDASCQTSTNSFITAFTTGMSYQAEYELTKHQEALKSAGYDIQSQHDIKNLSIQIADTITQMTENVSLNALQQQALNIQQTVIEPESTSIVIQHLVQTISLQMFSTLASAVYNDARMQDAINYTENVKSIQIETSFNTLIRQLEASVSTMETLVLSSVGKVLISVIALLLTAIILFAAYVRFGMAALQNQQTPDFSKIKHR